MALYKAIEALPSYVVKDMLSYTTNKSSSSSSSSSSNSITLTTEEMEICKIFHLSREKYLLFKDVQAAQGAEARRK